MIEILFFYGGTLGDDDILADCNMFGDGNTFCTWGYSLWW